MWPSVRAAWASFSEPLEGRVLHMYLDVKGLVTCGVGNLIDPIGEALKLPWKYRDGTVATRVAVASAWQRLKNRPDLARRNVRHALELTQLALSDADVDALVDRKLDENEQFIKKTLSHFGDMPADAQLGIMSMAWAVGPGFTRKFPAFTRAAIAGDWAEACKERKIVEVGNPGIVPRNAANGLCFANAATVIEHDMPRETLHWPDSAHAAAPVLPTIPPAPNLPSIPLPLPPTIRRGSPDSQSIALMQERLVYNGAKLKVDGKWGAMTAAALYDFQLTRGLHTTNACDKETWELLLKP